MYGLAAVFAAIALGFTYYGLAFMYDDSYANQVVGGDAYNFIIYATRGTAYVAAGIVFAVLSATASIIGSALRHKNAPVDSPEGSNTGAAP